MLEPVPEDVRRESPAAARYLDLLIRDIGKWSPPGRESITDGMLRGGIITPSKLTPSWPSAVVQHTAHPVIINNLVTSLTYDTEVYDVGDLHDPAVNPTRLTAVERGVYLVYFAVAWAANAVGQRIIYITKNGVTFQAVETQQAIPLAGLGTYQVISRPVRLGGGGYVEGQVYQNSGGNLGLLYAANSSPLFGMEYLHPY